MVTPSRHVDVIAESPLTRGKTTSDVIVDSVDAQIEKVLEVQEEMVELDRMVEVEEKPLEEKKIEQVEEIKQPEEIEPVEEQIVSPVDFSLPTQQVDQNGASTPKHKRRRRTTLEEKENIIDPSNGTLNEKVTLATKVKVPTPIATTPKQEMADSKGISYQKYIFYEFVEYLLDNWYFQKIPNNPKFSKVERTACEEWIVLVGVKAGLEDVQKFI